MAVSSRGGRLGYLTSGCLEQAVAEDALSAIKAKKHTVISYGENSRFLDFRLPCGGSLTFYIHVNPDRKLVADSIEKLRRREPFALVFDANHNDIYFSKDPDSWPKNTTGRLLRHYNPPIRFILIGIGPELQTMARVAVAADYETLVFSPDEELKKECATQDIPFHHMTGDRLDQNLLNDPWTAFVFLYHDLEREAPILKSVLASPAFYIGALGSRKTHEARLAALKGLGADHEALSRIHGPIGLIPAARDPAVLAISTIAEVIECYRQAALTR
jgi:xanthine dehydrogenase accessory factor